MNPDCKMKSLMNYNRIMLVFGSLVLVLFGGGGTVYSMAKDGDIGSCKKLRKTGR